MKKLLIISSFCLMITYVGFAQADNSERTFDTRQDAFLAGYNDGYAQGIIESEKEHGERRERELQEAYEQGRREKMSK